MVLQEIFSKFNLFVIQSCTGIFSKGLFHGFFVLILPYISVTRHELDVYLDLSVFTSIP